MLRLPVGPPEYCSGHRWLGLEAQQTPSLPQPKDKQGMEAQFRQFRILLRLAFAFGTVVAFAPSYARNDLTDSLQVFPSETSKQSFFLGTSVCAMSCRVTWALLLTVPHFAQHAREIMARGKLSFKLPASSVMQPSSSVIRVSMRPRASMHLASFQRLAALSGRIGPCLQVGEHALCTNVVSSSKELPPYCHRSEFPDHHDGPEVAPLRVGQAACPAHTR